MSGTGSRQNKYPAGPVFFLPLNNTACKRFKQFKKLLFLIIVFMLSSVR